jgi:hypothetical protein
LPNGDAAAQYLAFEQSDQYPEMEEWIGDILQLCFPELLEE